MELTAFLIVSILCLLTAGVLAVIKATSKYKIKGLPSPSKILFVGVVFSAIILFIPLCSTTFKDSNLNLFETILISLHNTIKIFIVDSDFEFMASTPIEASPLIIKGYTFLFTVLLVAAPILTFGFVLSFFKNISAYKEYFAHFRSNTYIFSELNEKSLALAHSLYQNNKKRFFVFTDVFEKEAEDNYELIEKAKEIGAICFKKDIATINFSFHSKKAELNFFAISENESDNITQAIKLVNKFKYRDNTNLYVFSTKLESEMLLSNAFGGSGDEIKIKTRRVNDVQALILRNLYENGYEKIFKSAHTDGTDVKKINALVIGMGKHGTEMTKALAWFCQMDDYLAEINSFDLDKSIEDKFTSLCPELMKFSGKFDIPDEAKYTVNIHSGIDVDTVSFDKTVTSLPRTTYVFVALGNDEKNLSTAVKLRSIFEREGYSPIIQAVIYDSDKKEALSNIANFRGQKYDIEFIGDIKSSYSEKVILDSDVEAAALKRHLRWGKESEFWQFNYNYKSSVAAAIHNKMKILCEIEGAEKAPKDRTEAELWNLRILEHKRWNAYVRSEGYIYGGTTEKSGRNDLAKTHNCLVPFAELPLHEQEKDDN